MRAWDVFHPLVLPFVPGCAEIAADAALRQAAIEFCQETQSLRRTLAAVTTEAGTAAYGLGLEPGEALVALMSVSIDGAPARLTTADLLRTGCARDEGVQLYVQDLAAVVLSPTPTRSGQVISMRAALKPTQDALGVDDALHEHYAQDIADGALSKLCLHVGRPYSNPGLAAAKALAFAEAKRKARGDAETFGTRIRLRVRPV